MVPRLAARPLARACSAFSTPRACLLRAPPSTTLPLLLLARRADRAARTMASSAPSASAASEPITHLTQRQAAALDEDLMNPETYGFSLDQLMELAGLSVAAAVRDAYPPSLASTAAPTRVLVLAGPGNNGGDGLVAARHLTHFGYRVTVCYPKQTDKPIFKGLVTQLRALGVPIWGGEELVARAREASPAASGGAAAAAASSLPSLRPLFDVAVDAVFGFSYSGGAPRAPFAEPLALLSPAANPPPVVAVDLPSGWHVEKGDEGGADALGAGVPGLRPDVLVSLTAPKLAARRFEGSRHYVGGRFVPPGIAEKYGLRLPAYRGAEQVALVSGPPSSAAATATAAALPQPTLLDPPAGPLEIPPTGDASAEAADLAAAAAAMRISYTRGELLESEVLASGAAGGVGGDPMLLFAEWFAAAAAEPGVVEPNAVCLATSDPSTGAPSARMVLLKNFTPSSPPQEAPPSSSATDPLPPPPVGGSFVVYTNFDSRKGRELFPEQEAPGGQTCSTPRPAALTFYWEPLQRSVRVEGVAEKVSDAEAEAYFASRPRGSQIGAWASLQSRVCEGGRAGLEKAEKEAEARFAGGPVPKPPHWGGVRVRPLHVEFWQGRPSRLHDRLVFEREDADEPWGGGGEASGAPRRLFP